MSGLLGEVSERVLAFRSLWGLPFCGSENRRVARLQHLQCLVWSGIRACERHAVRDTGPASIKGMVVKGAVGLVQLIYGH